MNNQKQIIISGFGGQGILSAGRILAHAGMIEDNHVSWVPSYGPEMRGGTANCHVIIAKDPIASPILSKVDILMVMNQPSFRRFEDYVQPGGLIISDSSIVEEKSTKIKNAEMISIPASKVAGEMGNMAFANIILLGKLFMKTAIVSKQSIIDSFKEILPEKKHYLIPDEIKALEFGMSY
jgi:2-oxoglutarate ferredoxin oxidoreductase subunit gamma